MAKVINVLLIDDLDGSAATETVDFALDGVSYEMDLSDKNAAKLREALRPFTEKAERKSGKRNGAARGKGTASSSSNGGGKRAQEDLQAIRAWARDNGHEISDKGRISGEIREAYDKANA